MNRAHAYLVHGKKSNISFDAHNFIFLFQASRKKKIIVLGNKVGGVQLRLLPSQPQNYKYTCIRHRCIQCARCGLEAHCAMCAHCIAQLMQSIELSTLLNMIHLWKIAFIYCTAVIRCLAAYFLINDRFAQPHNSIAQAFLVCRNDVCSDLHNHFHMMIKCTIVFHSTFLTVSHIPLKHKHIYVAGKLEMNFNHE